MRDFEFIKYLYKLINLPQQQNLFLLSLGKALEFRLWMKLLSSAEWMEARWPPLLLQSFSESVQLELLFTSRQQRPSNSCQPLGHSLSCWPTGATFFSRKHFNQEKYFYDRFVFLYENGRKCFPGLANRIQNNFRIKIYTMCKTSA